MFLVKSGKNTLASPIASIIGARDEVKIKNSWFPKLNGAAFGDAPQITAKSALIVNYDTGEVLYSKNAQMRLPEASIVKVMTALVALESTKISDKFSVSDKAANVGEDSMGLSVGEKLSLDELLYGMMLPSGNDAAVAIAEGISGSEDSFVLKMNNAAKALGMNDTKYINASGLDVDGEDQYTTAYDQATLARFAWSNYSDFKRVVSTYHYSVDASDDHKAFDLYNETNLLTTYPGVMGIKPGFTWNAGWCLMTIAKNDGKTLIGVILASSDRRTEMKELLDYGFSKYGIKISHPDLD